MKGVQTRIRRAWVRLAICGLVMTACVGSGGSGGTPSTASNSSLPGAVEHSDASLCDLAVVARNQQGTIFGTVEAVESPISEGLPNGYPGRTHALIDVNVSRVIGLHRDRADIGNDIPDIVPDSKVRLVVYHDNPGTPLDALVGLQGVTSETLFILQAISDAANPDWVGVWRIDRVVENLDGNAFFQGACGETLNRDLFQLAEKLGRKPDLELVADLAEEGLAMYNQPAAQGPLEQTLREIRGEFSTTTIWP